jgi:hypothetical protein
LDFGYGWCCYFSGHYIDFFNMIMPGTVGDNGGISEIASVLFFLGLFILLFYSAYKIHCYQKKSFH